jgi:uncharacterized protein (TIGR03437 family)
MDNPMLKYRLPKILLALAAVLCGASQVWAQTASPLTVSPTTVGLTFQKPSEPGSEVTVTVTAAAPTYFTVDPASVPIWMTASAMNGTAATTGAEIDFTPNSVGDSLPAGSYNGSVKLKVPGFSDKLVPVTLVISNPAPTLSVVEGETQEIEWTQGSAYPTVTLTMQSSNEPITFSAVAAVTEPAEPEGWLQLSLTSGIAYSWGTPVRVTFTQAVFDAAEIGDELTGTVTVTPTGGDPIEVAFTITIQPPAATVSLIYPSETAVQEGAESTDPPLFVVVTGTGFVASPAEAKTTVSLDGDAMDEGGVTVVSSTTIVLSVTPDYVATAGDVVISVQNPDVGDPATATLTATESPIVYAVTDAAALVQAALGESPTLAPFEVISIFGDNFGPADDDVVVATVDSFGRYPNSLEAESEDLTVTFYRADGTTLIADAYLLFVSGTQINAMVPSGVTGQASVKIVVTYAGEAGTAYTANVATTVPGIFTATASGTGQGAILHAADYSVNSTTNKAAKGSTVLLYLSGLGAPNSTTVNTPSTSAPTFLSSCISQAAYMNTVNGNDSSPEPAWTTLDGAVILSSNIATNRFAPCFKSPILVKVTIGGVNATVSYAGWIADGLAGLYQVNALVPNTVTVGDAVPVVVNIGTATSQSGVTMAIQ